MNGHTLIPVFPGTNCEKETHSWIADNLETRVEFLSVSQHEHLTESEIDAVILPGGFSYGDYLRAGAIASRSREVRLIKKWAENGVPTLGICNGFQVLCESGLLPGALVKNKTRQHHHFPVSIAIETSYLKAEKHCVWIPKFEKADPSSTCFQDFLIPMSCGMGNWLPPTTIEQQAQVFPVVRYNQNENGSYKSIAGLTNKQGNILGLMPHPERASDPLLGSTRGLVFLLGLSQQRKIKIKKNSPLESFIFGIEGVTHG